MIHTEHGRLTELIEFMKADRLFIAETLGYGPSGKSTRDKALTPEREKKLANRFQAQTEIIDILKGML